MKNERRHERESNFFYDHPALVATVVTIGLIGAFIGAIYVNATGHHGPSAHGSAHPSSSAAPATSAPKAR